MISKTKDILLAVSFAAFVSLNSIAQSATEWQIDKAHTSVNFSVNHFFSAVTGNFKEFEGDIFFDPSNLEGSSANFTISVASVDTDNEKRDKHLQSGDFFNEKKFPEMTFVSTKIEQISENDYLAHGKLTIKDVTKEVQLPLRITGKMEHPMRKGVLILGLAIDTTIDRTDYGVGTGDWAATMVVGDEVEVKINMELNRKDKPL